MHKQYKKEIIQGGYSEPILQPLYLVATGAILIMDTFWDFGSVVFIVAPIFFIVAPKAVAWQHRYQARQKTLVKVNKSTKNPRNLQVLSARKTPIAT
jgi:hypothetical protein